MKKCLLLLPLIVALLSAGESRADNSIVVESKTVYAGQSDIEIRIQMSNDDSLIGMSIPLAIVPLDGGSYPTHMALSFDERLIDQMAEGQVASAFNADGYDCDDGIYGYTDGFLDSLGVGHAIAGPPHAVMFGSLALTGALLDPGSDTVGSMVLTLSVNDSIGSFRIESTCVYPHNFLLYGARMGNPIVPAFTPGVITVVEPDCDCPHQGDVAPLATNGDGAINILDLVFLIDYVLRSSGIPPSHDEYCPANRGDVQCDGIVNIVDITYVQNYIYGSGPLPCQPCDCDPYPASCP